MDNNKINKLLAEIIKIHIDNIESLENINTISIKINMDNNENWQCHLVDNTFYGQRFFGDEIGVNKWDRFEIKSTSIEDLKHKCFLMSNNLTEKQFDAILIVEDIVCI